MKSVSKKYLAIAGILGVMACVMGPTKAEAQLIPSTPVTVTNADYFNIRLPNVHWTAIRHGGEINTYTTVLVSPALVSAQYGGTTTSYTIPAGTRLRIDIANNAIGSDCKNMLLTNRDTTLTLKALHASPNALFHSTNLFFYNGSGSFYGVAGTARITATSSRKTECES